MQHEQLEAYLREAIADIRARLAEANIGAFRLDIEASGRTHSGEANIEFVLGEQYGSSGSTRGGRLGPVIEEFLRRHGWNKRNAPLALSGPKEEI